jgi:hypothetical protein
MAVDVHLPAPASAARAGADGPIVALRPVMETDEMRARTMVSGLMMGGGK